MSGPTGLPGFQGIGGFQGPTGFTGLAGMNGPQGSVGVGGFIGPTGILGGTGIQLYTSGTLVQAGKSNTQAGNDIQTPITVSNPNPGLTGTNSKTISGQYDLTCLNYYGNPLTILHSIDEGTMITIPIGTYYITASMPVYLSSADSNYYYLTLQEGATVLATGTYANRNGTSYLQFLYTPLVDTKVVLYINLSAIASGGDVVIITSGGTSVNFSIVKIW